MRAAFVPEPNRILVGDFDIPTPSRGGDLVVRMQRASICGSDLHAVFHGFLRPEGVNKPGYPGHEGVGVVVESRSDAFAEGDSVLTVPVVGGCFSEYQLINEAYAVRLPPGEDIGRLLMAQQYGTTLFAMRRFWPVGAQHPGTAAIIGAGSAGLFLLQQVKSLGFEDVIVSDLDADRLAVARSLGADVTVQAPAESLVEAVHDRTAGVGADLVIEAVGHDVLRADALEAVRVQGTVGYFGYPERTGMAEFPFLTAYDKAVNIMVSSATQEEPGLRAFRDAVEHIRDGVIDVDYCLRPVYPLEQLPEAMDVAREQGHGAVKLSIDLT